MKSLPAGSPTWERTGKTRSRHSDTHIADLTRRLVALDEAAYREFFTVYYKRLLAYLKNHSRGNSANVEDALQQTFKKLTQHVKEFASEPEFWNWLCKVSRNTLIDLQRKEQAQSKARQAYEQQSSPPPPTSFPSHQRPIDQLKNAIETLRPEEQKTITLKYIDGLSYAEIAARQNTSPKAVESSLSRIRLKLRKRMKGEHPHE